MSSAFSFCRRRLRLPLLALLAWVAACKSDKVDPAPAAPTGSITFWNDQPTVPNITVALDGHGTGVISATLAAAPACGTANTAVFAALPDGNYAFSATAPGFAPTTGTVPVSGGICSLAVVRLAAGGGGNPTGSAMFWADQNVGTVTVNLAGSARTINGYYASQVPGCGASAAANFTSIAPGTYSYSASNPGGNTWNGSISIVAGQCTPQKLNPAPAASTGTATFWNDASAGTVTVNLAGQQATMAGYFNAAPGCGATGAANFNNLTPGSYPYTASSTSHNWSGTTTIVAGQCARVLLHPTTPTATTGRISFWTATNHNCGNILVTINGQSQNIANYYSSGIPACGASGTATFTLPPGSYNFTGRCTTLSWSGTVSVAAGGCALKQLL